MREISFTLVAMTFVPCLFAVDGVALINQSTVTAAGGFPYNITQPGSYRLTGNLTVPDVNTTAIQIISVNVTLDLNGFSIMGPLVCTTDAPTNKTSCPPAGTGIGVDGNVQCAGTLCITPGISVINGIVRGMGSYGIRLVGGNAKNVLAISNGGVGISVSNGAVMDSLASSNAQDGININLGVLSGSIANFNARFGIVASCPSTVVGNTAVFNNNLNLFSGSSCTLANNTAP